MKLFANLALAAIACVAIQNVSIAQDGSGEKSMAKKSMTDASAEPSCCSKGEESCSGGCPISKAMAGLPKMSFEVAGESTCCSASAASMAEAKSAPVQYVVGEDKFETKQAAYTSLIEKTEAMVNEYVTPCKCEVSGTTTIAGTKCSCPVQAGETAELVKTAVEGVQMSYAVGEEVCACPTKAAEMAKEGGVEKMFVIDGEKTSCEMTARLNLARAKYKAAVAAVVAQNEPAEQPETSGT